jgi:hypothetical protein
MKLLRAWVQTPGAAAVGWTLMHSLWEGAMIALALATVLAIVRSARARYVASCSAVLTLLVCTGITYQKSLPQVPTGFHMIKSQGGRLPELVAAENQDKTSYSAVRWIGVSAVADSALGNGCPDLPISRGDVMDSRTAAGSDRGLRSSGKMAKPIAAAIGKNRTQPSGGSA